MNIKYNLPLIFIIDSLVWGRFFIPVIALFYIASQVSIEQFTIIMAAFTLTVFLLEIPTGIFSDLIGRKRTLLLSRFFYIAEIFLLAFYNGFWPLLIAKIIGGLALSLSSGTQQAFLYDTLKRVKREHEHKRISGLIYMTTHTFMAFVFIIGAYLFTINPKLPAMASLFPVSIAFLLTFFLREPYPPKKKVNAAAFFAHFKESALHVWHHDYVKYLILFSAPIHAIIHSALSISSAYFEKVMIPISLIGIIAFLSSMTSAISSKQAHAIEERIGDKKSLFLVWIFVLSGTLLMSAMIPYIGVLVYFLIPLAQGFFDVLVNHYMNVHAKTSHRATILSMKSMANALSFTILFPIMGHITKVKTMGKSFMFLSAFLIAYSVVFYLYSRKLKLHMKKF